MYVAAMLKSQIILCCCVIVKKVWLQFRVYPILISRHGNSENKESAAVCLPFTSDMVTNVGSHGQKLTYIYE
jgi:hypothetical protein